MQIKPDLEVEYAEYKAKNDDAYGGAVVAYSEQWADAMELCIEAGDSVADCAKQTSHEVDKKPEFGITGFMYGCAVQGLSRFWVHGEELHKWHNLDTQIHSEGEAANESGGVLNPAIINVDI